MRPLGMLAPGRLMPKRPMPLYPNTIAAALLSVLPLTYGRSPAGVTV